MIAIAQTITALLAANLVAEFVIVLRGKFGFYLLHLCLVAGLAALALGAWQLWVVLSLVAAHSIDPLLDRLIKAELWSLAGRQFVQLAAIAGAAALFPDAVANGWGTHLTTDQLAYYLVALTILGGAVINLNVGGIVVAAVVGPLRAQVPSQLIDGLPRGSAIIGWLERALVLLLVLVGQAGGVGFLITAKAILRFSDASNTDHRKASEYIIIGTFVSFGWGLASAFGTLWALHYWLP